MSAPVLHAVSRVSGSYPEADVHFLLSDLADRAVEVGREERDRRIREGRHYADSLPAEHTPSAQYRRRVAEVMRSSTDELATLVGTLGDRILAQRGSKVVLVSLARAGTPIGVLLRRWMAHRYGFAPRHYSVSIVLGRGLDPEAAQWLVSRHRPESIVFVDGWTGKGAIGEELRGSSLTWGFDPTLAVLADPGGFTELCATREDVLVPNACLGAVVSGLISRSVNAPGLLRAGEFHGVRFFDDLLPADVSNSFVDDVSRAFARVHTTVGRRVRLLAREETPTTRRGTEAVGRLTAHAGVPPSLIKVGINETLRALLRRVPERVIVREAAPAVLRELAAERGVPLERDPMLGYEAAAIVRSHGAPT